MSPRATPPPRGLRRAERWVVGVAMAVVAFLLEKVVVRGLKARGEPTATPAPTTLTSRGGSVDAP